MSQHDVFHSGEITVQTRAGERAIAERRESGIRDRLNDAARAFVETQEVLVVGGAAPDASLWTTFLCGARGFVHATPDGDRVRVTLSSDAGIGVDPLHSIVRANQPLALLLIDLDTRRRLRINGMVDQVDATSFGLRIREAFGNCNKYIQRRTRSDNFGSASHEAASAESGSRIDEARRRFIARTDTLFVTSTHPQRGIDVSHRGGSPGFVRVLDDRALRIPDYAGNSMFQTLGNFEVDTRAAMAFIDFENRRILAASGHAVAEFGIDDTIQRTGGTGRLWTFTTDRWTEYSLPASMTWTLVEQSPFNPG
jgi:predicted pyridoxine 5'-phosphate oxidase superfamily flavin-nucleotide-binding protein